MGATDWPFTSAPTPKPAATDGLTLAVCGAHMDGLPLNHQLIERGAIYLGAATTTDSYRFYALAGDPPARPGLVKGTTGSGAPIAVELWSLPFETVGSFLKGIPAPLGIGTVDLSDGRQVKGFICEAEAIADSTDITQLGDWRRYLAQG